MASHFKSCLPLARDDIDIRSRWARTHRNESQTEGNELYWMTKLRTRRMTLSQFRQPKNTNGNDFVCNYMRSVLCFVFIFRRFLSFTAATRIESSARFRSLLQFPCAVAYLSAGPALIACRVCGVASAPSLSLGPQSAVHTQHALPRSKKDSLPTHNSFSLALETIAICEWCRMAKHLVFVVCVLCTRNGIYKLL